MKTRIIQPNSWLNRVGGRWITSSGIDVTKFLWSLDKKFWYWITSMPEEVIEILMPQLSKKYINKHGEKAFRATIFETNRYRARMIHKLAKYAKRRDIYAFNNLMKILTRNSKSFRMWIYDSTSDFKVKDKSVRAVMQCHLKFQKMVRDGIPNFKFKRIWIPKADGTQRPLAVPNLEDRWLAKIMLEYTLIWLEGSGKRYHENQFGSITGRSCAQAWNKVIKEIVPKKFILEFDVAKCYDTLSWDGIWKWMLHCDFPQAIQNYILKTITSAGRNLPKEEYRAELNKMRRVKLIDQSDLWNIGKKWDDRLINRVAGKVRSWFEREYIDKWENWEKIMKTQLEMAKIRESLGQRPMINADTKDMPAEIIGRLKEHIKMKKMGVPVGAENLFDNRFNRLEMFDTGLGIPQGWALSPLLCNYQIKAAFKAVKTAKWVTYLDDGILGADSIEDFNLNELLRRLSAVGLRLHPSKTKLCKENGRWIHDIKFLGALLKADGRFIAATRKGATQTLLTPPTTILSGKEAKDIVWNDVGLNFIKEVQLDEAQLAWMYNNGGVFDSNGNWTPVNVGKMWQKSWNSHRMNQWKVRNPDLAYKIDTWLEKERTTY